jgi:hypothetical protein
MLDLAAFLAPSRKAAMLCPAPPHGGPLASPQIEALTHTRTYTEQYLFVELQRDDHPLVRDGSSALVWDLRNPAGWRRIDAQENLFCSAMTVDSQGNLVIVGGADARTATNQVTGGVSVRQ